MKNSDNLGFSFYATELMVFLSQVAVIFLVAFFTTDLLRNETRLAEFAAAKINGSTMGEIGLTLVAITLWLGVLTVFKEFVESPLLAKIFTEVLAELPRTIYFFGSSISAVVLAIAFYTVSHPESSSKPAYGYFSIAGWLALTAFIYGCGLKALLTSKARRQQVASAGSKV